VIGGYSPWFSEELVRRVTEEKIGKAVDLATGAAPDYAAYQYACSLLAGLDLALDIAEGIKKAIEAA